MRKSKFWKTSLFFYQKRSKKNSAYTQGLRIEKLLSRTGRSARPPLRSVGSHGAPYFYPAGDPGPPTLPRRGPWGPLRLCSLPEKNFRRLCRRKFFSASRSSSGAHGAPYFYPVGDPGPPTLARRGPWGPFTVGFPTQKKFRRACAPEFFLSKSFFFISFSKI